MKSKTEMVLEATYDVARGTTRAAGIITLVAACLALGLGAWLDVKYKNKNNNNNYERQ